MKLYSSLCSPNVHDEDFFTGTAKFWKTMCKIGVGIRARMCSGIQIPLYNLQGFRYVEIGKL